MIGRLTGKVVEEESEGAVLLEVGGVAYEVFAPLGTVGRARGLASDPRDAGTITLHIHTHVREDVFSLFGFATAEDKFAFRLLISVSNVGPKTALAVLSVLSANDLAKVLAAKDIAKLVGVPGIGRKTAERLMLELKDKLLPSSATGAILPGQPQPAGQGSHEEILARALTGMGYRAAEADRAVQLLRSRLDTVSVPELIREALALLAR